MKKISTILCFMLSLILFSACTEQEEPGIMLDPDLVWLNEKIQEMEGHTHELSQYQFIKTGIYEGGRVFLFANCCPHCNTVVPVYNVDGELLGILSYSGETEFSGLTGIPYDAITKQELYWKPKNSACNIK